MLNYEVVKSWPFEDIKHTYTYRDTILYALGVGLGADPLDRGQLRYTYEKELLAIPSMAAVLASAAGWMRDPKSGIDYVKLVHVEQDITLHRLLPAEGTVHARSQVTAVVDKGEGKGALIEVVREIYGSGDEHLATVRQINLCRGDGGYTALGGKCDEPPQSLPAVPEGEPDIQISLTSLPQAALIYRLSGDWNPLHGDPDVAQKAGFLRPILHGLCTYGMAAHAVLREICSYEAKHLKRLAMRFSSPVYPGETVRFQLWRAGEDRFHLRARVNQRDVTVLNNGWVELTSLPTPCWA